MKVEYFECTQGDTMVLFYFSILGDFESNGISVATNYLNHIELHYTLSILLMTDIYFLYIFILV